MDSRYHLREGRLQQVGMIINYVYGILQVFPGCQSPIDPVRVPGWVEIDPLDPLEPLVDPLLARMGPIVGPVVTIAVLIVLIVSMVLIQAALFVLYTNSMTISLLSRLWLGHPTNLDYWPLVVGQLIDIYGIGTHILGCE